MAKTVSTPRHKIAAVGVRVWSNRSWLFSILFTALPYLLIYGIWAFFALR